MLGSTNTTLPLNVDPDIAAAALHYSHGNFEDAIRQLVETTPGDVWAVKRHTLEALICLQTRKYEEAISAAEAALEQDPETTAVHLVLARVCGEHCSGWHRLSSAWERAPRQLRSSISASNWTLPRLLL